MNSAVTATPHAGLRRERIDHAWKETLYLLLDLAVGVAGFTVIVTGMSLGLGLLITLIGIPIIAVTLLLARWAGRAELARARALLDLDLPAPGPLPREEGVLARIFAPIRDATAWKAAAYFVLMLPAGIATFTIAVTWWAASLAMLTLPAWAWALPHNGPNLGNGYYWSHVWQLALSTLAGVLLTLAAPYVMHWTTYIDRGLLRLLRRSGE